MKPEDCPVRATVDVIGGKWKPLILILSEAQDDAV